jgi:predicted metal-dependent HD superfamily phosphohydrolase
MGVNDAPPWLETTYIRSVRELGATAPEEQVENAGARLLTRWSDRRRIYHGLKHLQDMLSRIDQLAPEAVCPAVVRLAAYYHGAVFEPEEPDAGTDPLGPDGDAPEIEVPFAGNWEDEAAGAKLARRDLAALGVPPAKVDRVVSLVLSLEQLYAEPGDSDAGVLVDAGLGMLSVDPEAYRDYLRQVREENAAIPARQFLKARIAALDAVSARPTLFRSPGAAAWEAAARDHLGAESARDRAELQRLDLGESE